MVRGPLPLVSLSKFRCLQQKLAGAECATFCLHTPLTISTISPQQVHSSASVSSATWCNAFLVFEKLLHFNHMNKIKKLE
jgi:hypothetical protein